MQPLKPAQPSRYSSSRTLSPCPLAACVTVVVQLDNNAGFGFRIGLCTTLRPMSNVAIVQQILDVRRQHASAARQACRDQAWAAFAFAVLDLDIAEVLSVGGRDGAPDALGYTASLDEE
jgi:hypothetical protein